MIDQCTQIVCHSFGNSDHLTLENKPIPPLKPTEILIQIESIGVNRADMMMREGLYKIASGAPPFTPGLEAGGRVIAKGHNVTTLLEGQLVTLDVTTPRIDLGYGGTYRSHYITDQKYVIPLPDTFPAEQSGMLWLAYLTAYGCLISHQNIRTDQYLLLPAASSSVAIAAGQIARSYGVKTLALTRNESKIPMLEANSDVVYDHIISTDDPSWWKQAKSFTDGKGFDVIFDPVAAGPFLNTEIRLLAQNATLWVYGLLEQPGVVDVTPLIRKHASIRGFVINMMEDKPELLNAAYKVIIDKMNNGIWRLPIAAKFDLSEASKAQDFMARNEHIGKILLHA